MIGGTRGVGSRCLGDRRLAHQSRANQPHATTLAHQPLVVDPATLPAQAAAPDGVRESDEDGLVVLAHGGSQHQPSKSCLQDHSTKNTSMHQEGWTNVTLPQLGHKKSPASRVVRERRGRELMRSILILLVCCPRSRMLFARRTGPTSTLCLLLCHVSVAG